MPAFLNTNYLSAGYLSASSLTGHDVTTPPIPTPIPAPVDQILCAPQITRMRRAEPAELTRKAKCFNRRLRAEP